MSTKKEKPQGFYTPGLLFAEFAVSGRRGTAGRRGLDLGAGVRLVTLGIRRGGRDLGLFLGGGATSRRGGDRGHRRGGDHDGLDRFQQRGEQPRLQVLDQHAHLALADQGADRTSRATTLAAGHLLDLLGLGLATRLALDLLGRGLGRATTLRLGGLRVLGAGRLGLALVIDHHQGGATGLLDEVAGLEVLGALLGRTAVEAMGIRHASDEGGAVAITDVLGVRTDEDRDELTHDAFPFLGSCAWGLVALLHFPCLGYVFNLMPLFQGQGIFRRSS